MRPTRLFPLALLLVAGCNLILTLDEYGPSTCDDGVRGGAEADIDCGGPACAPCADGRACKTLSDCSSGLCLAGLCVAPTCDDAMTNGSESDIDCGGADCPGCPDGEACAAASDCLSIVCEGGICQPATCSDNVKNGAETDSDCGGGTCNPCAIGEMCLGPEDCVPEAVCKAGLCAADHLWSKAFGDMTKQEATGVAVDPKSGAVLIAGLFNGSTDFGGVALMSAGSADVFVAKLDGKDGDHVWSKGFGDANAQFDARITADSAGGVFLACTGFGTMNFGIGDLPSAGASDVFLLKLNEIGGPLWHARYGDANGQFISGIAADMNDNIVLVGTFGGTMNFGGGPLVAVTGGDLFIAGLKGFDGSHVWSKSFAASIAITQPAVAVDAAGNVLLAGRYEGSVSFGGEIHTSLAGPDAFVAKFNEAGDFLWSKSWGSTGTQGITSIAAAPNGDVYVAGTFENAMELDPGAVIMSQGGNDPFVAKLGGADGSHSWVQAFGDAGENQEAQAVASDSAGNAIVAGRFDGALNVDTKSFKASGTADLYVAQLDPTGKLLWLKQGPGPTAASAKDLAVAADGSVALVGTFIGALSFGGEGLQSPGGPGDAFVTLLSPP